MQLAAVLGLCLIPFLVVGVTCVLLVGNCDFYTIVSLLAVYSLYGFVF